MPISFTNHEDDTPVAETVDDFSEEESEGDDESQISASDFEGDLATIPLRMMFGPEECGAIFSLSSDKGAFFRVCGCKVEKCRRGHQASRLTNQAKPGSYETVRSRKYADGKLETWIPVEEYEAERRARKAKQVQEFAEAAELLTKVRTPGNTKAHSPSVSEEEAYAYASNRTSFGAGAKSPSRDLFSPGAWDKKRDSDSKIGSPKPSNLYHEDIKAGILKDESKPEGKVVAKRMEAPDMMNSMMEMMSGVQTHLKGVSEDMKVLREEQREVRKRVDDRRPQSTVQELIKEEERKVKEEWHMGSSLSPKKVMEATRSSHKEWYAVLKGKDGASGVFESYDEARVLVYRISGAIWKKFRTYDEAWLYLQDRLMDEELQDPEWYYGVANGKQGFSGVISEYPTAQGLVEKVSGASWKKFRTHQEAARFVHLHHRETRAPSPKRRTERKSHFGGPGEKERSLSPRGEHQRVQTPMSVTPDPRSIEGEGFEERNPRGFGEVGKMYEGYRPPLELAGEDPSTGKDDEVWGMDLGAGEIALREKLCPPDLPVGLQKGLMDGMIDAVAQPGGSMGGADAEVSETEILGHALNELVYQGRVGTEDGNTRRTDLNWRAQKRTTLREITTLEKLRKRIKILIKLRERMPKRIVKGCKNSFIRAGWTDPLRIDAWSQGGYFLRVARDSLDFYLSLHQHLMGLGTTENVPWSYVQVEIDHHVDELDLIRSSQDSRIQAILGLYAYLRDGESSNWHSSSLQYKRNLDTMALCGSEPLGRDSMPLSCRKCQTTLHSGGSANCPWKNCGDASARKQGANVLINWGKGICAPEPPSSGA